ncbi:MAG: hypothetical protein OXC08_16110 [Thiotrichales bacterium]|nr:hypothetical protein [Thiotrichales bacterium]
MRHAFDEYRETGGFPEVAGLDRRLRIKTHQEYWGVMLSRTGREVDFVACMPDGSRMLVQVCESVADPRTRRREVAALRDVMAELDLQSSVLVTRGELGDAGGEQRIAVDSGMIEVVAGWRFVLDLC